MKLGLQTGYWQAEPKLDVVPLAREAERLGYDSVWTGESYSSDAFTPLTWIAAHTSRIGLATGVAQLAARPPATLAMQVMTLDALSGGRLRCGIGVSGPQVVEGWYGQPFARPIARTREYVDVVRRILAREGPVAAPGPLVPLPYPADAPGAWGMGRPLKLITRPLRPDVPFLLGAEGPRNVALAFERFDGWIPLYWSPFRSDVYEVPDSRPAGFEIAVNVTVRVTDDVAAGLLPVKASLGFYIGGMGHRTRNFHTELMARMGFEAEAHRVQDLFFDGKRIEAIAAVPDAFADEISLVGPVERIRDRLAAWRDTPVTTLIVGSDDPTVLRTMAELVL